jgi:pimeloyl-ACP methyl ester carboxylesterase
VQLTLETPRCDIGDWGDPGGDPVLFCGGAAAAHLYRHPDDGLAARRGLRLLTVARPGFAGTPRRRGRSVASWVRDVETITDALGIARFGVFGHSGGGPYALACAAALPDRVVVVATIGSLAPLDSDERFAALGSAEPLFRAAAADPDGAEALIGEIVTMARADLRGFVRAVLGSDRATAVPGFEDMLVADAAAAMSDGASGWADEVRALAADWGFALDAIRVPQRHWYGEDDDLFAVHGSALAALTGAAVERHPGGHHGWPHAWEDVLDFLKQCF